MVLLSVLMGFLFLMAGVFIPPMSMPHFWHVCILSSGECARLLRSTKKIAKISFCARPSLYTCYLNMPPSYVHFLQAWAYQVDPFRYFTEGIMSTALDPLIVRCSNRDFFRFSPPPGLTCGNYTAEFLTYATG